MPRMLRHYDWGNWLAGMWVAFITGGTQSIIQTAGLSALDSKDFNLQAADNKIYKAWMGLFGINAGFNFVLFLRNHPLPDRFEEEIK